MFRRSHNYGSACDFFPSVIKPGWTIATPLQKSKLTGQQPEQDSNTRQTSKQNSRFLSNTKKEGSQQKPNISESKTEYEAVTGPQFLICKESTRKGCIPALDPTDPERDSCRTSRDEQECTEQGGFEHDQDFICLALPQREGHRKPENEDYQGDFG